MAVLAGQLSVSRQHLYAMLGGRVKRLPDWDTMVRPLVETCTAAPSNDNKGGFFWCSMNVP